MIDGQEKDNDKEPNDICIPEEDMREPNTSASREPDTSFEWEPTQPDTSDNPGILSAPDRFPNPWDKKKP